MLLSRITVNPAVYQKRETSFSQKTVDAILAEGIDLAKFDAIPLLPIEGGQFVVGGDGHSRFSAISELAKEKRLPAEWAAGDDWDVPHKLVDAKEARELSWTANLKGNPFTACEQAKVFQEMLDAGYPIDKVATLCHVSENQIRQALPLNGLARDIRALVGLNPDAGGIEVFIAKIMAAKFQQYNVPPITQSTVFHRCLAHVDLTAKFVRSFIDSIGGEVSKKSSEGLLFELPANVENVMAAIGDRAQNLRRADRGLSWLIQCSDSGVLDELYPELKMLLQRSGKERLAVIKARAEQDGEAAATMCLAKAA